MKVEAEYVIARENHNPMEPHATIAAWNGDNLTLWSKSQFVVNEQAEIAAIFGLPPEKRAGELSVHRRRVRHQPENLAARHPGGSGRGHVNRPVKARAHPQTDVLRNGASALHAYSAIALGRRPTASSSVSVHEGQGRRVVTRSSWRRSRP